MDFSILATLHSQGSNLGYITKQIECRSQVRDSDGKLRERVERKSWGGVHLFVYNARHNQMLAHVWEVADGTAYAENKHCKESVQEVRSATTCAVAPAYVQVSEQTNYVNPPQEGKSLHRLVAAAFGRYDGATMPYCLPVMVYAGAEPVPRVIAHNATRAKRRRRVTQSPRAVNTGSSCSSSTAMWRDAPPAKPSEGRKPLVYCLDRHGVAWLTQTNPERVQKARWRGRHNRVSGPFLAHLLATSEVRVAIELACRQQGIALEAWQDERQLRSRLVGQQRLVPKAALIPDGCFRLVDREFRYHQFLEVDRATETVGYAEGHSRHKTFARKIQAYLAYYGSGRYARHFRTQALRVLTVTTGPTRLRHLRKARRSRVRTRLPSAFHKNRST